MLTQDQLDQIEHAAEAATPGPYEYRFSGMVMAGDVWLHTDATDADLHYQADLDPETVLELLRGYRESLDLPELRRQIDDLHRRVEDNAAALRLLQKATGPGLSDELIDQLQDHFGHGHSTYTCDCAARFFAAVDEIHESRRAATRQNSSSR